MAITKFLLREMKKASCILEENSKLTLRQQLKGETSLNVFIASFSRSGSGYFYSGHNFEVIDFPLSLSL